MANSFTQSIVDWVTMESLFILKNSLQVAKHFDTSYNKEFEREFPVGETVRVKYPQRFRATEGLAYQPQAIDRRSTNVTVDQIFGVHFEWDSAEKALSMERGKERIRREYLVPAMSELAQQIDSRAALWAYQHTNNIVGSLGVDPTDFTIFNRARQRLIEMACPPSNRKGMLIAPQINTSLTLAAQTFFQPPSAISKQYTEGAIGRYAGFDWYESMSLWSHTAGTWQGAVTVNGADQTGTSLDINCTSGDTFFKGDVIGIDNVFAVNPKTRRVTTTAQTKQFRITEDFTATGSTGTIQISPGIEAITSQYQNVDALPADSAALTLFPGTSSPNGKVGKQSLALHPNAFAMVGVKLEIPKAAEMSSQSRDPETGLAVAFVRMFDPNLRKMVNRFDVLMGFGDLYPDNCAVRVLGA